MNAELNRQNHHEAARSYVAQFARNFSRRRKWIRCPKCIGGNMYREISGEYTCLQCGCSCYPDTVTGSTKLNNDCSDATKNLQPEIQLSISR